MPRPSRPDDLPDDERDDRPRRAKPSGGVPVWAWVLGGIVLLGFAGCAGVGLLMMAGLGAVGDAAKKATEEQKEREAKEKLAMKVPPGELVDAGELFAEYKNDSAAATAKYAEKPIRVRLRVDETRQLGGNAYLIQRIKKGGSERVECRVPVADAASARTGGTILIVGKVDSHNANDVTIGGRVEP